MKTAQTLLVSRPWRTLALLALAVSPLVPLRAADDVRSRALAAAESGRWETAEPELEQLATSKPDDAAVCAALARRRLQQKRSKEAVELLERSIAAEPTSAAWHSQLGNALGQRIGEVGFMQQATMSGKLRGAYERSIALDPNHVAGYIGLARYHAHAPAIAGGSLEKAESYALEAEKRDEFQGRMERGLIATKAERPADAVAHYRRAAELRPAHAWAQTCLGRALVAHGDAAGARVALTEALRLAPDLRVAREALEALEAGGAKVAGGEAAQR